MRWSPYNRCSLSIHSISTRPKIQRSNTTQATLAHAIQDLPRSWQFRCIRSALCDTFLTEKTPSIPLGCTSMLLGVGLQQSLVPQRLELQRRPLSVQHALTWNGAVHCPKGNRHCSIVLQASNNTGFVVDWTLQSAVSGLLLSYACWTQRPRGWADSDLIEVKESEVHGRGVFVKADIPKGTILGTYPGRRRSSAEIMRKVQHAPDTRQYIFHLGQALYLDPTDQKGQPSQYPSPGLPWLSIDPSMAYVNEPTPSGSNVNLEIVDGLDGDVMFKAAQELKKGEELYIDYGRLYDRTMYKTGP